MDKKTREMFSKEYLVPMNKLIENNKISKPDSNKIKDEHRIKILKQGRADFDQETKGLSPNELVDLYCFYYLQMHYTSSIKFYVKEEELIKNLAKDRKLFFIDFGCGPMTSGIAFHFWINLFEVNHKEIYYMGIDSSESMLNKIDTITKNNHFGFKYNKITTYNNSEAVIDVLKTLCTDELPVSILLNFSYFFSSESISVQSIINFTNQLLEVIKPFDGKLAIFHQNPWRDDLNYKWEDYKKRLKTICPSKSNYPLKLAFQFKDIFGSWKYVEPRLNSRFDLIKNF